MSDQFVAEIRIFCCNFAPKGWAFCNGQLLPVSQNTAFYALLGTTYGGDGMSTFALPDLKGRAPMAPGQSGGTSNRTLGETGGQERVLLLTTETPSHTHDVRASTELGDLQGPGPDRCLARSANATAYQTSTFDLVPMAPETILATGADLAHNNMQPYLVLNFCIAQSGIYPPHS
jgi:microcystin-dependent protein